jgi:hypothetical protein
MSFEGMLTDVVTIAQRVDFANGIPTFGTAVKVRAWVEPYTHMVRGADEDLHQSHARIYLPADTIVTSDSQVTLPDGTKPEVLTIKRPRDSNGEHHVEVVL